VYTFALVAGFLIHKKPVRVRLLSLQNIKNESQGPLLDRIDIHIEVPRVDYEKLSGNKLSETSEVIRQRVQAARELQRIRFSTDGSSDIICNADMRIGEIRQFCHLQAEGGVLTVRSLLTVSKHQSLMRAATSALCVIQLQLSARAYAQH